MAARIALVLFLLAASFSTLSAAEVDEQTRSEWRTAIRALASPDPVLRRCGVELLGELPNELPDRKSSSRILAATMWGPDYGAVLDVIVSEQGVLRVLIAGDDQEAALAAVALIRACGEFAAPLAADLKQAAANPAIDRSLRFECAMSLMFVLPRTESAFPHIIDMWTDLIALPEIDQPAEEQHPRLFGHNQYEVRSISYYVPCLTSAMILNDRTQVEIPVLARIAQTAKSWQIRLLMLKTLAALESESIDVLPNLEQVLNDEDKAVRVGAASAILSIQGGWSLALATRLAPPLKLTDEELVEYYACYFEEKRREFDSLRQSEVDQQRVMDYALDDLLSNNSVLHRHGIMELQQLGSPARFALPVLHDKLWAEDELTRRLATETIRAISGEHSGHRP